ncbi:hypothetical protein BD779DRAFT_1519417 [Infundibulicybe gibba]|nr:hypothetical protein BD779DRAFT_1519417 [Infundibulicybe gibba]
MATDNQFALTRTHKPTIAHVTKKAVPATFLQKLYEIVNDPKNFELIRWSEAGDSFFVLDHERFAREVLGHWFKHQKFSSFVRQLNMYGFHKIPHLQQGVLKSNTDIEIWNFKHEHFRRGLPDSLCLIQRKGPGARIGEDITMDIRDPSTTASTSNLSSGQILDIHSIVNGIAAIKRHQTTISAELNELKRSNQLLWQESLAARAKHQKQQDTINRIVKFLAGVFGHQSGARKDDPVDSSTSHAVIPRLRSRLMIEDGRRAGGGKVGISQVQDGESVANSQFYQAEPSPIPLTPYPIVETPSSMPSPSSGPVDSVPPPTNNDVPYPHIPNNPDSNTNATPAQKAPESNTTQSTYQPSQTQPPNPERSVTPSHSPTTSGFDFDPRVANVFNSLTPAQLQQLLTSLASQSIPEPSPQLPPQSQENTSARSNQLTSYQPQYDFNQLGAPHMSSAPSQPSGDGLISFDATSPEHGMRLENSWQATEDIDKDVNALTSSINSLIQTYGLDPNVMVGPEGDDEVDISALDNPSMPAMLSDANPVPNAQEFDFDAFFNALPSEGGVDLGDMASSAFLDEAPSPSDGTASPMAQLQQPPLSDMSENRSRKRKSDVSELDGQRLHMTEDTGSVQQPAAKPKRRKDK